MTAANHKPTGALHEAARWLATARDHAKPRAVVPALRAQFGLSAKEACEAIMQADLIRGRAI